MVSYLVLREYGSLHRVFFIEQYATNVTQLSQDAASYTSKTSIAASVVDRILPGLVADPIRDSLLALVSCTICSTILVLCWIDVETSDAGLFVFCVLYGFFPGTFASLSTPVAVALAPNMEDVGKRLGMFNFIGSLGIRWVT